VASERTANILEDGFCASESRKGPIFSLAVLSGLLTILYAPVLGSMARQWRDDPNYGHGVLVPVFVVYVLWRVRERWHGAPLRPSDSGLPVMLLAVGLLLLGTLGAELFTTRFSLVLLISGIIVFLAGWPRLRSVAFPVSYLAFMIPLPAIIYYQLTFPLQLLASRLGAYGLVALGVPTIREGNLLLLPNCTLEVVEACSGVRSLLSLLAAVVAYVYFAEPAVWKRMLLVALTVPVVIASNGLRLIATGVLSFIFGRAADSGLAHASVGLVFFALALLAIVLIHSLLRRIHRQQALAPAN
jgi:exosortase